MNKNLIITSLLMLLCLTVNAQKNAQSNKFKEGTSEYYAAEGQRYLKAGKIDDAKLAWKKAKLAKNISCDEICLGGDILMKENNQEAAYKQYRRAIYFDRKNPMGYMRVANAIKKKDIAAAAQLLDTLKQQRPDMKVEGLIADLYYDAADYHGALAVYDSMSRDTMSDQTLVRYSASAYFSKDYQKSLELSNLGHVRSSRHLVFNRFRLYNNTELEHYDDALTAANDLFYNSDSVKVQYLDYLYYGYALNGSGRTDEAVAQFDRAVELSTPDVDISNQISDAYLRIKKYDQAASYYQKYVDRKKDDYNKVYDTYHIGYIWWQKAINDTTLTATEKEATFKKAGEVFHQLSVLEPDNYIGYYWEAKANTMIDQDYSRGLAKPYYAKVIEICEKDGSHQSALIEACKYMAYYNYLKKNMKGAHEYAEKVLDLDPMDSYALSISEATR